MSNMIIEENEKKVSQELTLIKFMDQFNTLLNALSSVGMIE